MLKGNNTGQQQLYDLREKKKKKEEGVKSMIFENIWDSDYEYGQTSDIYFELCCLIYFTGLENA